VILGSVLGGILLVGIVVAALYIRHRIIAGQSEGEEADVEPPVPTETTGTYDEGFQADEFYNPVDGSENEGTDGFSDHSDEGIDA
jgi:hypothetical protein